MANHWTIATMQAALQQDETSAVETISSCLTAIDKEDGEGARTFVRSFKNTAITQAAASDTLRKMKVPQGPLAGIPISVKDLFDVEGEPTTAGSKALSNIARPATRDALVVARMRAAGAILVGHTNMTELAYSGLGINPHFGTPLNGWERSRGRVPGGSSSGAALSVADQMCVAAIGTDTGGSVRIPAAFNRLYGFKPSFARHPLDGVFPLGRSLDTVGPLANSIACCRLLDHIMAGLPIPDPALRPVSNMRLGILETLALDGLDVDVAGAFVRALETISRAGARLERIKIDAINRIAQISALGSLLGAEAFHLHRAFLDAHGDAMDPRIRARISAASTISAADYIEMLDLQADMKKRTHLATRQYDALLLPTVAVVPPEVRPLLDSDELYQETNLKVLRNTTIGNLLGRPAATIPISTPTSPPVGLMIMGEHGADADVLAIAESIDLCLNTKD